MAPVLGSKTKDRQSEYMKINKFHPKRNTFDYENDFSGRKGGFMTNSDE